MYQHLLVPIDGTPLATATVACAVSFAKSAGARITFFQDAPDLSDTGDGALHYTLDGAALVDAQRRKVRPVCCRPAPLPR